MKVDKLIIKIESYFKYEDNKNLVVGEILEEVSKLIEETTGEYYKEILNNNSKVGNNKKLEVITFLKDFSIQLQEFKNMKNLDGDKKLEELLKYNIIYFKSLN